jgi:hypothetical protein
MNGPYQNEAAAPIPLRPKINYDRLPKTKLHFENDKGKKFTREASILSNQDPMCVARTTIEHEDIVSRFGCDGDPKECKELFREMLSGALRDTFDLVTENMPLTTEGWRNAVKEWTEHLIAKDKVFDQEAQYIRNVQKPANMTTGQFRMALENIEKWMRRLPRTDWDTKTRVYSDTDIRNMLYEKQTPGDQSELLKSTQNYKTMSSSELVHYFDVCLGPTIKETGSQKRSNNSLHDTNKNFNSGGNGNSNKRQKTLTKKLSTPCREHNGSHLWRDCIFNWRSGNYKKDKADEYFSKKRDATAAAEIVGKTKGWSKGKKAEDSHLLDMDIEEDSDQKLAVADKVVDKKTVSFSEKPTTEATSDELLTGTEMSDIAEFKAHGWQAKLGNVYDEANTSQIDEKEELSSVLSTFDN